MKYQINLPGYELPAEMTNPYILALLETKLHTLSHAKDVTAKRTKVLVRII